MKAKPLFAPVICAWLLIAGGCGKDAGKINTPSKFVPPAGPVELKEKYTTGERISESMVMTQSMEILLPNRPPMEQTSMLSHKYDVTVLSQDAEGGHELLLEFLSARILRSMNGKVQIDYDSDKELAPDKKNEKSSTVRAYSKIVGTKIHYFMDASNRVQRLEGVAELDDRLAGDTEPGVGSLKDVYNEAYFKQMMSGSLYLPSKPVQIGDTWPVHVELPMGDIGTLQIDHTFTFKGWEMHGKRECARLEFEGTIVATPPANPNPDNPVALSFPSGTTAGTSWFDPELGVNIDSRITEDMTMVIHFLKRRNPAMPAVLTNDLNQVIQIKVTSLK